MVSLSDVLRLKAKFSPGNTGCSRRKRAREAKAVVKLSEGLREFHDTHPGFRETGPELPEAIPEDWPFVRKG